MRWILASASAAFILVSLAACANRPLDLPACRGPSDCAGQPCCYDYAVEIVSEAIACYRPATVCVSNAGTVTCGLVPACPNVGVDIGSLRVCVSDDDCGPAGTPFVRCCPKESPTLGSFQVCLKQCD